MMLWSFGRAPATMLHPGMRSSLIFNAQHVEIAGRHVTDGNHGKTRESAENM